jgi:hypothetical protein
MTPDSDILFKLRRISKDLFPWLSSKQLRSLRIQFLSDLIGYQIESSYEFDDWDMIKQMKTSEIAQKMDKAYGRCFFNRDDK